MKLPEIPPWLDRLDKKFNGVVVPFVIGVNVGAVLTVIIFIVSFLIMEGL